MAEVSPENNGPSIAPCTDCEIKDRQIELLRQKLEYALYQNKKIRKESERLRSALIDTQWQLKTRGQSPPPLPNEIWHAIFCIATDFEGLAFSPEQGHRDGADWRRSVATRRSIPLVCKQWAVVGREFLYNHMVFYHTKPLYALRHVFRAHPGWANWCRNIELLPIWDESDVDNENAFYDAAYIVMGSMRKLRTLSIDPLGDTRSPVIKELICLVEPNLETLHLSPSLWNIWPSIFSNEPMTDGSNVQDGRLVNLHTLCLRSGKWHGAAQIIPLLFSNLSEIKLPALRTVSLDWPSAHSPEAFRFLRAHQRLVQISLGKKRTSGIMADFEAFMNATPNLQVLSLETCWAAMPYIQITTETRYHTSLERIIIQLGSPNDVGIIKYLDPIFNKLKRLELPVLKSIKILGGNPDGCLDPGFLPQVGIASGWKEAIRTCQEHNIALTNESGKIIHLWKERHGYKVDRSDGSQFTASDSSHIIHRGVSIVDTSDDESWTEDDGERMGTPEWETGSDEELDDSDDSPYVYQSQPDLRQIEEDSDSEDW